MYCRSVILLDLLIEARAGKRKIIDQYHESFEACERCSFKWFCGDWFAATCENPRYFLL